MVTGMDFALTDEQQLVRETAATFADNEIAPVARETTPATATSTSSWSRRWPPRATSARSSRREYGGAGLDYRTYGLIVEEVGRADSSVRTVVSVQTSLVCSSILKFGHRGAEAALPAEALQRRVARLLRADRAGHRLRRRQPEDARAQDRRRLGASTARRCGSRSATSRRSRWSSRRPTPSSKHKGVACFLVDTDQDGFQPSRSTGRWACTASDTASIALDDVHATDDQMLGEVGDGFKIAMSSLDSGRFSVAAGCVGVCQALPGRVGEATRPSASSSAARSRRSSSCRR